jgi:3-hydroxybutyryl-CoA dehydrogenase
LTTVAIVGAGPVGRWLALAAAHAGYRVLLEDVMPANLCHAREALRRELDAAAMPAVAFVPTIEEAVREADLVIDCVPDELESKLEIFCLLDRMAPPRTVLVTPTARLSIADLAACTYRSDKCVGIEAEAGELAERVGSDLLIRVTHHTARETVALVRQFCERIGFRPRFAEDVLSTPPG